MDGGRDMINGISLQEDQQELVAKANAAITEAPNDGAAYGRRGSDESWVAVPTTPGGSTVAWVDITDKPPTFPPTVPIAQSDVTGLTTALAGKEPTIAPGTALQVWKGDKTWGALNKAAVGLDQVDNTSDVNKPVSTAQAAAIATKLDKGSSGDTMTGNLTISKLNPAFTLNMTAVGQAATLYGSIGGVLRWTLQLGNGATETGLNAGSNFAINRYADGTGAYINTPFYITRLDGACVMGGNVTAGGSFSGNGIFQASAGGAAAILASQGASVVLRPNGSGSSAGQAYVDTAGGLNVAGAMTFSGVLQSTGSNLILGGASGAIYMRPVGAGSTVGEAYLDTAGAMHSHVFHPTGDLGGFRCRTGGFESASADVFNFTWDAFTPQTTLWINGSQVGSIAGVSDYRTKKDVLDLGSTWEHVRALRPISYTQADHGEQFKASDDPRWGFVAHELQETLIPSAATGVKDGPDVQSPNPWTIIAALTRTVQEMQTRIEALEAK
jgi:hypothetical protein